MFHFFSRTHRLTGFDYFVVAAMLCTTTELKAAELLHSFDIEASAHWVSPRGVGGGLVS